MKLESYFPLLLDLLLKSTALIAIALLLSTAFRRASAANRHAIGVAALAALLLLPFTNLVTPRWSFALNPQRPTVPMTIQRAPISATTSSETVADSARVAPPQPPASAEVLRVSGAAAGVGVWVLGFALVLVRRAVVGWQLRRLAEQSRAIQSGRVLAMVREWSAAWGVRVDVRESDRCRVPLALGMWRHTVLLPAEAMEWSEARLCAALRHEFGHVSRRDCFTRWLADLACAFYWVNPLAWFGARLLRLAQEQACDDLVLNAGTCPDDYATQLVEVVRGLQGGRFSGRHALAMAQPSMLEARVRAIVDEGCDRSACSVRGRFAGITFATAAFVLCTAVQLRGAEERKAASVARVPEVEFSGKFAAGAFVVRTGVQSPGAEKKPAPNAREPLVEVDAKCIEIVGHVPGLPDFLQAPEAKGHSEAIRIFPIEDVDRGLKALDGRKGVAQLSWQTVITHAGQQERIECVREFVYPTDWEKERKSGRWLPARFDTKNVGVTFDVTPEVEADGTLQMQTAFQAVDLAGFRKLHGGKTEVRGRGALDRELSGWSPARTGLPFEALFDTRKVDAALRLSPGMTAVLRAPEEGGAAVQVSVPRPRRQLFVLVTARIVEGRMAQTEEAAGVPGNPKTRTSVAEEAGSVGITAEEITLDEEKGVVRARGGVKIDTPQAVISGSAAEVTLKKPGDGSVTK
ncbi:MAG: hypothetical protein RLZZ142_1100 [Verrucomicrobiota bacterium]